MFLLYHFQKILCNWEQKKGLDEGENVTDEEGLGNIAAALLLPLFTKKCVLKQKWRRAIFYISATRLVAFANFW